MSANGAVQAISSLTPSDPATASARGELTNLDALRALAVVAVLVDHLILTLNAIHLRSAIVQQCALRLGRLGVVAFFVHTFLVLLFSLERLHAESPRPQLSFYLRRVFRIYPLSVLTVFLVSIFQLPELPLTTICDGCYDASNVVYNLLLLQNLFGSSVIGPLWSLPLEVQMYIFLPAVYYLTERPGGVRRVAGLIGGCALLAALLHAATGALHFLDFVPCFLCGALAYGLRGRIRARFRSIWWVALVLCVLALGSVAGVLWWRWQEPIGWIASLALGASLWLFDESRNAAWNAVTKTVARYSYGIYLLHVPCLWLVFQVFSVKEPVAGTALALALTLGVSIAAFHAVEQPMIRIGKDCATRLASKSLSPAGLIHQLKVSLHV